MRLPLPTALCVLLAAAGSVRCGPVILTYPGSTATTAYHYDSLNRTVSGSYTDTGGIVHGYTYDAANGTYSAFNVAGALTTTVYDDQGGKLVGAYTDIGGTHGYVYDTSTNTLTTLDDPNENALSRFTTVYTYDTSSGRDAGSYTDSSGNSHGYYYDGTYHTIDRPGATTTAVYDYESTGSGIAGDFTDATGRHGYFYDGTYHTLNYPGATATTAYTYDAVDRTVVGTYTDGANNMHGFVYDTLSQSYTAYNVPGATTTFVYDDRSNVLVGTFVDAQGGTHGFINTPEPSSLVLLGFGAASLSVCFRWLAHRRRALCFPGP